MDRSNEKCLTSRGFSHVYRNIDDPTTISDSKKFENSFKEIYPEKLGLHKEIMTIKQHSWA